MQPTKVNWDKFKCRCSGITKILSERQGYGPLSEVQVSRIAELENRVKPMTEPMKLEYTGLLERRERSKEIVLSNMCVDYLMEVYAWETQGMISVNRETLDVAQLNKGKLAEGEAGTLLCRVDRVLYKTHKDRINNEFLSGQIDLYLGEHVMAAEVIPDIKCAFDYPGFLKKITNGLGAGQREQIQGYCDITGAKVGFIANCLVDNPDSIVEDLKYKLARKLDAVTIESPEFLIEWAKWERSMKFSHIPAHQRVHKIPVEPFTESERQKVYDRVKHCRDWLFSFDERYQKLNK